MKNSAPIPIKNEKEMVLLDQAIFSGNSFVTTALFARFLGIEEFGIYSSIVLGVYLIISICNAIIIQPFQVSFSQFNHKKSYIRFTLYLQLFVGFIIILILYTVHKFTHLEWIESLSINFIYLAIFIFFWVLHDYFRKLFLALQKIRNAIVIDTTIALVQLIGIIILEFTLESTTLNLVILIVGLSYVLSSIIGLNISGIRFLKIATIRAYIQYHRKQGAYLLLTSLLQWWGSNLFVITSGVFINIATLGAFRLVQSMFGVLNLLLQTYENYVLPKAAKIYANSILESKTYLKNIVKKGGILFLTVLIPLFIFSKKFIYLFGGPDYLPFHYLIKGMVVLYIIIYLGYSVRIPIRLLNLNQSFFVGYCISFAFSIISFQFLLSHYNAIGTIIGLIINQVLMNLYWYNQLVRHKFNLWK